MYREIYVFSLITGPDTKIQNATKCISGILQQVVHVVIIGLYEIKYVKIISYTRIHTTVTRQAMYV